QHLGKPVLVAGKTMKKMIRGFAALCILACSWLLLAQQTQKQPASAASVQDALVNDFFEEHFHFNPTQGTSAGFHQYDAQLEDYSQKSIQAQIASAHRFLDQF